MQFMVQRPGVLLYKFSTKKKDERSTKRTSTKTPYTASHALDASFEEKVELARV